jgi:hypothetical protein
MNAIYLVINGQQAGPYTLAQARELLANGGITRDTLARHDGLANWVALGSLLAAPGEPPAPPIPASVPPASSAAGTGFSRDDLRRICKAQNLLMWAVLANICGTLAAHIPLLGIPILLVIVVFVLYAVCQLASALRYPVWAIVLLCLSMFIPCVSLIVMVVLSVQASKFLKAAGVRVGLMGGRIEDIKD